MGTSSRQSVRPPAMLRALFLVGLVSLANGFMIAPLATRSAVRTAAISMGVEEAAAAWLEEECSVDTVDDLIKELKAELKSIDVSVPLSERQKSIFTTIEQLEALGAGGDQNELVKIIASAARSFSLVEGFEFPGEPLGYTGKVGTTVIAGKTFDK